MSCQINTVDIMRIFVAIPSYRDRELSDTVASVIKKADHSRNLSFGICQQDDAKNFVQFRQHRWSVRKINLHNIPAEESQGSGWALKNCFDMYDGEEYFMQIDSHTEMVESWDSKMLQDYALAKKITDLPCIFSSYPEIYTLDNDGKRNLKLDEYTSKTRLVWGDNQIIPDGNALPIQDDEKDQPLRARYLNGGFMFGDGSFAKKVIYNPECYFWGTEIYTTIRCYTHGFDLFHPTQQICWHHYGDRRQNPNFTPHHWNDVDDSKRSIKWSSRATASKEMIEKFLVGDYSGPYGVGTVRSLDDYQRYAQVDLVKRIYLTEEAEYARYKDS